MKKEKKKSELSFTSKVILFFRLVKSKISEIKLIERINNKQKKLAMYEGAYSPENSRLSYYFGISKVISLALLIFLLCVTLLFGSSIISYENVYYMFKDIGYINSFSESHPSSLNYSKPVENQEFAVFKGGLAAVSDSEIKFFTSTGRATLTKGSEYTNPKIVCSDSMALIYDQGRKGFSIYNSFISLYSEELDAPISSADISKSGSFLIVTETAKYRSVVRIYDKNYNITNEYSKNDLVISAQISDSGRYAAVLSMTVKGGESESCLNIVDCKRNEIVSESILIGKMPYFCEFLTEDRIALFFTDSVYVVDRDGKTQGEYKYPSSLEYAAVNKDRFLLVFKPTSISSESIAAAFDRNGSIVFIDSVSGTIKDVGIDADSIYILKEREILKINSSTGSTIVRKVEADDAKLVVFENGEAAVCTFGVANYISFN